MSLFFWSFSISSMTNSASKFPRKLPIVVLTKAHPIGYKLLYQKK
ncbi:uncharacterized protein METZ01_LOCUS368384 [marine metagenome]|uniref:Uncharacterized protein n=1 Tax=marine metagenome TaxID=408172 RepID=A0A382SZY7_9ZZZZ